MRVQFLTWAILLSAFACARSPAAPAQPISRPIIVDPGHGGNDLGTVVHRVMEKSITYSVARKLRERLRLSDARMTRESDQNIPLDRRVNEAIDWHGRLFVSLHVNESHAKNITGCVIYSYGPDRTGRPVKLFHPHVPHLPPPPPELISESSSLADAIARAVAARKIRAERRRMDYYVLKNPVVPSVLVELGYLSNPEEAARLQDPAYQNRLAEAIAAGIKEYEAAKNARPDPRKNSSN